MDFLPSLDEKIFDPTKETNTITTFKDIIYDFNREIRRYELPKIFIEGYNLNVPPPDGLSNIIDQVYENTKPVELSDIGQTNNSYFQGPLAEIFNCILYGSRCNFPGRIDNKVFELTFLNEIDLFTSKIDKILKIYIYSKIVNDQNGFQQLYESVKSNQLLFKDVLDALGKENYEKLAGSAYSVFKEIYNADAISVLLDDMASKPNIEFFKENIIFEEEDLQVNEEKEKHIDSELGNDENISEDDDNDDGYLNTQPPTASFSGYSNRVITPINVINNTLFGKIVNLINYIDNTSKAAIVLKQLIQNYTTLTSSSSNVGQGSINANLAALNNPTLSGLLDEDRIKKMLDRLFNNGVDAFIDAFSANSLALEKRGEAKIKSLFAPIEEKYDNMLSIYPKHISNIQKQLEDKRDSDAMIKKKTSDLRCFQPKKQDWLKKNNIIVHADVVCFNVGNIQTAILEKMDEINPTKLQIHVVCCELHKLELDTFIQEEDIISIKFDNNKKQAIKKYDIYINNKY